MLPSFGRMHSNTKQDENEVRSRPPKNVPIVHVKQSSLRHAELAAGDQEAADVAILECPGQVKGTK